MANEKKSLFEKIKGVFSKKSNKVNIVTMAEIQEIKNSLQNVRSELIEFDRYMEASDVLTNEYWQKAKQNPTKLNIESAKNCERVVLEENAVRLTKIIKNYGTIVSRLIEIGEQDLSEYPDLQEIESELQIIRNVYRPSIEISIKRNKKSIDKKDAELQRTISFKESEITGKKPNAEDLEAQKREDLLRVEEIVENFITEDDCREMLVESATVIGYVENYVESVNNEIEVYKKVTSPQEIEASVAKLEKLLSEKEEYVSSATRYVATYFSNYKDIESQVERYLQTCNDQIRKKQIEARLRENKIKVNYINHFLEENEEKTPKEIEEFIKTQIETLKQEIENDLSSTSKSELGDEE